MAFIKCSGGGDKTYKYQLLDNFSLSNKASKILFFTDLKQIICVYFEMAWSYRYTQLYFLIDDAYTYISIPSYRYSNITINNNEVTIINTSTACNVMQPTAIGF